jgi:hypothetical protein
LKSSKERLLMLILTQFTIQTRNKCTAEWNRLVSDEIEWASYKYQDADGRKRRIPIIVVKVFVLYFIPNVENTSSCRVDQLYFLAQTES